MTIGVLTAKPAAALRCNLVGAADAAEAYFESIRAGDRATLEDLLATIWHAKRAGASDSVVAEARAAFLQRVGDKPIAHDFALSAVIPCFDDFAIVRADDWVARATAFLLLFKERGAWKIAGEASVAAGARDAHFAARTTEADVLGVLERYYRAVTEGDPDGVRRIFAPVWHMKNHDENAPPESAPLVAEETDAFAARLEAGPLPTYWDDRQIADVQIAGGRIAYVRVDRPSTPSTTVFLFAREQHGWMIIDKAWTDGRKPAL